MITCPYCKRVHIHALHCPNPEPLPHFERGDDMFRGRAIEEADHA